MEWAYSVPVVPLYWSSSKISETRRGSRGPYRLQLVQGAGLEEIGGLATREADEILDHARGRLIDDPMRDVRSIVEDRARTYGKRASLQCDFAASGGHALDAVILKSGAIVGVMGGTVLASTAHHNQVLLIIRGEVEEVIPAVQYLCRDKGRFQQLLRGGHGLIHQSYGTLVSAIDDDGSAMSRIYNKSSVLSSRECIKGRREAPDVGIGVPFDINAAGGGDNDRFF